MSSSPYVIKLNNPRFRKKIAAFDYDWTLVCPKSGGVFATNVDDWDWRYPCVIDIVRAYHKKGYGIYIFTNQSKEYKINQIKHVASLFEIPLTIAIATDKNIYKPDIALWDASVLKTTWDKAASFYVGDAAGRPEDWSDMDKLFAEKIGVQFKVPENVFATPIKAILTKSSVKAQALEAIIMVGYPGSGKSTFAAKHFSDYFIVSGDELKTVSKMIKEATTAIQNGKSVVFDATNPSVSRRQEFITWATKNNLIVKCVHLSMDMDRAFFFNSKRDSPVPKIAYYMYKKKWERPNASEGCDVFTI